jgi:alkanesulfonate monooxygenase SsuD/methylene tetrahydromethanopterin reductase-like flavin-dependent oxidoreductase (luciferase family)
MAIFNGELGLQFVTHLANQYTVRDLVRLARVAADAGFQQIWVNDNIRYRSQIVVLTAIAFTGTNPPRHRDHGAVLL